MLELGCWLSVKLCSALKLLGVTEKDSVGFLQLKFNTTGNCDIVHVARMCRRNRMRQPGIIPAPANLLCSGLLERSDI